MTQHYPVSQRWMYYGLYGGEPVPGRDAAYPVLLALPKQAVSRIISVVSAASGAPANYLLFDHAYRTHRRLGVSPETEMLAVQVVRAAHVAGQSARGQDAMPRAGAVPLLDPA